jgi:hypothetical protein
MNGASHRGARVRLVAALAFGGVGCTGTSPDASGLASSTEGVWVEQQRLVRLNGAANDYFGASVAIENDLAVIGMPGANASTGSVVLFTRTGSTWSQWQSRSANDGMPGDLFGSAVALSGDSALIGAYAANAFTGAAYATTLTDQQRLTASDGEPQDYFGASVAISGDTAMVGAPMADATTGAVYVFARSGTTWNERQKLTVAGGRALGQAIAISGDEALISTATVGPEPPYIFVRSGSSWIERHRLIPSEVEDTAWFGTSVALAGDVALVAATVTNIEILDYVYAFARVGSSWTEVQKFTGSDVVGRDSFASSIATDGNVAVVGCANGSLSSDAGRGAAYVFTRSGPTWSEDRKLTASNAAADDRFGTSVSLSGDTALIGARNGDGAIENPGAAYAFVVRAVDGETCASSRECLSGHCVDGRCCNTACTGACNVCSAARGSVMDGVCAPLHAGSIGYPACHPLSCNGESVDCSPCTDDTHCPSAMYCAADDTCKSRKALAESCDTSRGADCKVAGCRACESGHCADGVCCDEACGECSACLKSLTGENDGTCAPVPAGADPNDACEADGDYPTSCGADGDCDGRGACRAYASRGTACGDTTCDEADDTVSGFVCNGEGDCEEDSVSCAPFACAGDECADGCSDDSDCAGGAYCLASVCTDKRGAGRTCEEGRECLSGHCADGVCCNNACEGQCEACNETDTGGTCTQVLGSPRGERPACPEHLACSGGECTAVVMCSEDGLSVLGDDEPFDCRPFRCRSARCLPACTSGSDCAPGARCTSDGECVAAGSADAPAEDSGCGCRTFNAPRTNNQNPRPEGLIIVAALGAAFFRRRAFRRASRRI